MANKNKPEVVTFPPTVEGHFKTKRGRRVFVLDLKDRVKGLWDDGIGIPIVNQCTIEGVGVNKKRLSDMDYIRKSCETICRELNLNIEKQLIQTFDPGITAVFILSESHLAMHTWPETGYIHVDVVTCTRTLNETKLVDVFGHIFQPLSIRAHKLQF